MGIENTLLDIGKAMEGMDKGFWRSEIQFTGTTRPFRVPVGPAFISAAIHPSSGTARVEFTLSSPASVESGTARWIAWPFGDVSQSKADALISAVTAIRGVASANAVLEVCAR